MTEGAWPLSMGVFALGAVVTVSASIKLAALGDGLADRLGLGEALFGAVFFDAITSLSWKAKP